MHYIPAYRQMILYPLQIMSPTMLTTTPPGTAHAPQHEAPALPGRVQTQTSATIYGTKSQEGTV